MGFQQKHRAWVLRSSILIGVILLFSSSVAWTNRGTDDRNENLADDETARQRSVDPSAPDMAAVRSWLKQNTSGRWDEIRWWRAVSGDRYRKWLRSVLESHLNHQNRSGASQDTLEETARKIAELQGQSSDTYCRLLYRAFDRDGQGQRIDRVFRIHDGRATAVARDEHQQLERLGYFPESSAERWDPLESTCRHASLSIL